MATSYFDTAEQVKAKNWDMLEEAKSLRSRLYALEGELKKFSVSWKELGRECCGSWVYQVDQDSLRMLNPSRSNVEIGRVPWAHFDAEAIKRLFTDLEQTKDALREAEARLRDLGIGLL